MDGHPPHRTRIPRALLLVGWRLGRHVVGCCEPCWTSLACSSPRSSLVRLAYVSSGWRLLRSKLPAAVAVATCQHAASPRRRAWSRAWFHGRAGAPRRRDGLADLIPCCVRKRLRADTLAVHRSAPARAHTYLGHVVFAFFAFGYGHRPFMVLWPRCYVHVLRVGFCGLLVLHCCRCCCAALLLRCDRAAALLCCCVVFALAPVWCDVVRCLPR